MKKPNYKQFEDPRLQEMVEREIASRTRTSSYPVKSIAAFIAQNFNPNSDLMRVILSKKLK